MFIEPLALTIEQLVDRWREHNVTPEQVITLCRQSDSLELVFPFDGRTLLAYKVRGENLVLIGECMVAGFLVPGGADLGRIIREGEGFLYCVRTPAPYRGLLRVESWKRPDLDYWQSQKIPIHHNVEYEDCSNADLSSVSFMPKPETLIISNDYPQGLVISSENHYLYDHLKRGRFEAKAFVKRHGKFCFSDIRITLRSVKQYESLKGCTEKPQSSTISQDDRNTQPPANSSNCDPQLQAHIEEVAESLKRLNGGRSVTKDKAAQELSKSEKAEGLSPETIARRTRKTWS